MCACLCDGIGSSKAATYKRWHGFRYRFRGSNCRSANCTRTTSKINFSCCFIFHLVGPKLYSVLTVLFSQTGEISTWQRRIADMTNRVGELEENLAKAQKELLKAQEINSKLQRDLQENVAQKEDQEERIATLEKRYLNAQRESTSLHDLNEKLEQELQHKEAQLKVNLTDTGI